jgi:hypothetical protein
MIDEKRSRSDNDQLTFSKKANMKNLSIKERMTLRRAVDLRFVDISDSDSSLNDEMKSSYAVIIAETLRKDRSLREVINVTSRKVAFEYFINAKIARARKLRNQRLQNLDQDSITRVKRNDDIAIRYA